MTAAPVFHPLRVSAVQPETDDAVSITFEVPPDLAADFRYLPGQHVTLRAMIEGEDVRVTGDLRKLQPPSRLDRHAEELVEQILRLDPQAEYEVPSRKQSGEGTDE